MGRSLGTKETQGINGDATALQSALDAALERSPNVTYEPCPYARHLPHHTVTPDGPLTCGICHPTAATSPGRVSRGEPGFDELATAARGRMTGRRPRCPSGCGTVVAGTAVDLDSPAGSQLCAECAKRKAAADKLAAAS